MREACSIVDPNRHACGGQRIAATCASARRRLVGDHPNINAAFFGPNQRPDNAGTDRQAVSRDEDLSLRVVNGANRECRAILFGRETDRDRRVGRGGGRGDVRVYRTSTLGFSDGNVAMFRAVLEGARADDLNG
jgi:hypothetical protein